MNIKEFIPVQFEAGSVFKVAKNEATLTLADSKKYADNKTSEIDNKYSQLKATTDSINSTVSKQTTSISDLAGKVQTNTNNISKVTQNANSIESTVSTINNIIDQTSQERRNLISGSYLRRVTKIYGGRGLKAQIVKGKKYTFSFNGYCTQELLNKGCWLQGFVFDSSWKIQNESISIKTTYPTTVSKTFTAKYTGEICIDFYPYKDNITQEEQTANKAFIVVNWCQLEEGEIATPWTLSEGEPVINPNLISSDINDWLVSGNGSTEVASVINDGCTLPDGSVYDCIHAKNTGTNIFDAVTRDSCISLDSIQSYTLSFYAKGAGTITSYLYPTAVMGWIKPDGTLELDESNNTSSTDGNTPIKLTSEWTKYIITWTALCGSEGTKKNMIIARLNPNTDAYIAGVKLERGGRATAYQRYTDNSISKIVQTATEIRQQVGDSYTSLKNGNFTIGANTKIQGNLNVTGTENKITVVNDDSTQITQIQPVSVGTWSDLQSQSTISLPLYKTNNYSFITDQYGHINKSQLKDTTGNLPVTEYFDVGDFIKNDSIQFNLRYCHRLNEYGNEVSQFSCKFDIYSISEAGTMTLLKTANSGDYFTLTLTDDGTIRVKVSVTIILPTVETFTPNSFATLTYKLGLITVIGNKGKLITTVGYDGISGSLGNGNYFMLGKDVAAFKYGKYELKMTKDGIIGLNAKKVKRIQAYDRECTLIGSYWTFNCDDNSDYNTFIGIGTSPIKLLLPSNPIEGQEITVVDKAFGQSFMVQPQGGYKTCFDGSTSSSTYTGQHELPTNTTWHFIFSYDTWYAE